MFDWLRERRRREILKHPFPSEWTAVLQQNIAHWRHLNDDERSRLQQMVQVFVEEKDWEGCGGLEITDEIRVTIAGLACLLLLGLEHLLYRNVQSILVYPAAVVTPKRMDSMGDQMVVERAPVPISGEAMMDGPVLLVWDAIQHGARHPEQGHNVVYHEFAHKLDMLDGSVDGTPPLVDKELHRRWVEVCTADYHTLRERSEHGQPTFLDPYGGTDVGEFFAVATEHFFDQPVEMQDQHPQLYGVLSEFYRQDPAARVGRSRR